MPNLPTHRTPTHPGEMLREEFMRPLKITQEELAGMLGVTFQTVSRLVNSHQRTTPNMAARLARLFGTTPEFWLDLQRDWDVWHELRASREEIRKIAPLPTSRSRKVAGRRGANSRRSAGLGS